ncbi:hypothetical protein [Glycomyces sp. YM15]|uniref:hypothetical protein n=1 Tax=Glycomyces sp. YM15 TaxID=2800446 RepID=UPI0019629BB1|nr:hypothetical protein [Glycomyces sp. YM15]
MRIFFSRVRRRVPRIVLAFFVFSLVWAGAAIALELTGATASPEPWERIAAFVAAALTASAGLCLVIGFYREFGLKAGDE